MLLTHMHIQRQTKLQTCKHRYKDNSWPAVTEAREVQLGAGGVQDWQN